MSSSDDENTDEQLFKNFTSENWGTDADKQLKDLQTLENHLAKKQGRADLARNVKFAKLKNDYGQFSIEDPKTLSIDLIKFKDENFFNREFAEKIGVNLEGTQGYFAMSAVVHERLHGYIYDVLNKRIDDESLDKATLKAMGQNFFVLNNDEVAYFSQPLEVYAFENTYKTLVELRGQIAKFGDEELKKYDDFLKYNEKMLIKHKKEAVTRYNIKDENFERAFKRAEQWAIEFIDKKYEELKEIAKRTITEMQRFDDEYERVNPNDYETYIRKTNAITANKRAVREGFQYPWYPEETLLMMERFERGESLTAGKSRDIHYNHPAEFSGESKNANLAHSSPPIQDKDKRAYINELYFLQKEIYFLENANQTNPEQSIEKTIENLRNSQDKLYGFLAYHGVTAEEVYRVIMEKSDKAIVKDILKLQKSKNTIEKQLSDPALPLQKRQRLENALALTKQEYAAKWNEIIQNPDKDNLIRRIEQATLKNFHKSQAQDRTQDQSRGR